MKGLDRVLALFGVLNGVLATERADLFGVVAICTFDETATRTDRNALTDEVEDSRTDQ